MLIIVVVVVGCSFGITVLFGFAKFVDPLTGRIRLER
jgi:hypothetical protein